MMITDHWQVIEGCLEGEISKLTTESTWWEDGSGMQKRILADLKELDAAIAFVREQRAAPVQGQPQPDWSQAPEWANWWAVDADGKEFWYRGKPITGGDKWRSPDGHWDYTTKPCPNWKDTLTQRPQPADTQGGGGDDGE